MSRLDRRVAALERRAPVPKRSVLDLFADARWYSGLTEAAAFKPRAKLDPIMREIIEKLEAQGTGGRFKRLSTALDRGIAWYLFADIHDHNHSIFELERLRGCVPDAILADVYNQCRNYAYPSDVQRRVWKLAGVVDENGDLMPGYVLRDNGLINDADELTYLPS